MSMKYGTRAEIFAAIDNGATIQWRELDTTDSWLDMGTFYCWHFDLFEYRIKPSEPIKEYQWILEFCSSGIDIEIEREYRYRTITPNFYASREDVLADFTQNYYTIIGPALWTMIEV